MLISLIVTIVTEGIVMYLLTHDKEWVKYNIYCNLVTNPILNFALLGIQYLFRGINSPVQRAMISYYIPLVCLEVLVFWAEAWLYGLMTFETKRICFRRSIITNAVSMGIGLIFSVWYYFFW